MDFDKIKERAHSQALQILQALLPAGKLVGREFMCGDIYGAPGDSFRYNIDKHVWSDFAAGVGSNDIISFVAASKKIEQGEAARWVADFVGHQIEEKKETKAAARLVVPATGELEKIIHPQNGVPTHIYEYRDEQGRLLNYICRWDMGDGKKDIRPYTQTAEGWRWVQIPTKRPLYGLPKLTAQPKSAVLLVEGEKAVIAAQAIFKNAVVMSWSGGSKAVKKADFTPLHGRRVCLWPDNDDAGRKAMDEIGALLVPKCETVKIVGVPDDMPAGWDCADAQAEGFFNGIDPYKWIKENSAEWTPPRTPSLYDTPTDDRSSLDQVREARHFDALGFENDEYFFYSHYKKQHCKFKPTTFKSDANLLELAPENYWRDRYPNGKGDINFRAVTHALMSDCWRLGVFNPASARVRGIGAWWDNGRVVMHLGDKMLVNGQPAAVGSIESEYVYHQMASLEFPDIAEPTQEEIAKFIELTSAFTWENPLSAYLLRGWCAVAPVCGALRWRPHIWITGKAGSGKTWILQNVAWRMVEHIGMNIESLMTSESGVRNSIGINAMPVTFDEIEGESRSDVEKVQAILKLARIASSDTTAKIIKATQTGGTKEYIVKSCFAFASIAENIKSYADESRITLLNLQQPDGGAAGNKRFKEIEHLAGVCAGDFPLRMFKRSLRLVPVIRKNADVFAQVGALLFGSRRIGDQLGTLLAGAFSMVNDGEVDFEQARKWVETRDFSTLIPVSADNTASPCLDFLLQNVVTVKSPQGYTYERTIGELCRLAMLAVGDKDITNEIAHDSLRRRGILAEREFILIANQNPELERIFKDSVWLGGWAKHLKQVNGADNNDDKTIHFAPGCKQKCTRIRLIFEGTQSAMMM